MVLSLSSPVLLELMSAVFARRVSLRFRATGFSMHPFIKNGDVVTVSPTAARNLRPGDVVACRRPGSDRLFIHRIVARRPGGYVLRGDNTLAPDGLIPSGNILGRVTRVERGPRVLRLGWGPERRLLAWLARHELLQPLVQRAWRVRQLVGRGALP